MRFAFIAAEKAHCPLSLLCKVLGVSRSGYYAWRRRGKSRRVQQNEVLAADIVQIHQASRGTYGSPRVHAELRARGRVAGRHRVARLMRKAQLTARPRRRVRPTTDSNHTPPVAPNVLDRSFRVEAPNVAWVTDITYIWTREGWLYLAAILDLFSRRVVGWAMSETIDRKLPLDALDMALRSRRPSRGLLHHSDRGSQYASADYRKVLERRGIQCSMSRRGNCWDNAVAESFFGRLKTELVHQVDFPTRAAAKSALFDYIEVFYNRQRRHSHLGYVSPAEFEKGFTSSAMAA